MNLIKCNNLELWKQLVRGSVNVVSVTSRHPVVATYALLLPLIMSLVVQVFSPLRLCTDAISLLSVAQSAAAGSGFLDHGERTVFPPGYPALVALLLKAGLGHPWAIVALNAILCGIGMVSFYAIMANGFLDSRVLALNLCSLSLLSWVLIKHFSLPLTEIAFFAVTMLCLYALDGVWRSRNRVQMVYFTCIAWVLTAGAVSIRRTGVALIPALIYTLAFHNKFGIERIKTGSKFHVGLTLAACGAALLSLGCVAVNTSTLSDFAVDRSNIVSLLPQIAADRLTELGEIGVNIPSAQLPSVLRHVLPLAGLIVITLVGGGIRARRRTAGPTVVFLGAYACILFVWPYYDPRFWLPVIPLLFAFASLSVVRLIGSCLLAKRLVAAYFAVFVLLGIGALGYSSWITFSGPRFPDRYGDGNLRSTYCRFLRSCSVVNDSRVNPKALNLLYIYQ